MKKLGLIALVLLLSACADDGSRGPRGYTGAPGQDGTGCSVEQLSNGAIITCSNTTAVVYNGTDGQDGVSGTLVEVVTPCPATSGPFKEVLLRLSSGQIIALFDGGANLDRLVVLTAGSYRTTDGYSCNFTVNTDGSIN